MNASTTIRNDAACYELRYQSLADDSRAFAFPCDAAGRVDIDSLSQRVRNDYFYARTVVGREFSLPSVQPSAGQ